MKETDQMYQRIYLDSFMDNMNISDLDKEEYYNIINKIKTNLKRRYGKSKQRNIFTKKSFFRKN